MRSFNGLRPNYFHMYIDSLRARPGRLFKTRYSCAGQILVSDASEPCYGSEMDKYNGPYAEKVDAALNPK